MNRLLGVCAGVFVMAMAATASDHSIDLSDFDAVTMSRTGSFELDMSPDDAFPLFTAPGEELWVPGWEPFILNGDGYEEGTVWVTMGNGHPAYWYVADYDIGSRYARYVRVTPEVNTGTVEVRVAANQNGGSTVSVTYRLTGLSEDGNRKVREIFGESAYAEMMEQWRDLINESRDRIDAHRIRES